MDKLANVHFGELPRNIEENIEENTHDLRDFIAFCILTDDYKYNTNITYEKVKSQYKEMSLKERSKIDNLFIAISGYSLSTILSTYDHLKAVREANG